MDPDDMFFDMSINQATLWLYM